ncbi:P27 family phage terminase small subunit [Mesorhizobium sp. LHD-90]|uniref:P27 family phage terminase small subunit n=1 Tax=Mesorhizobium sp. LHD-90 TaxID=3071414 RepID=UPI0027E063B6|nr:P27 family phage terminase small subunit [Mesorhizobium sp. LHD-90]MDQ6434388.1 P27 family phage terminase small subunit [Mesorhizobium sp. LHD-90]
MPRWCPAICRDVYQRAATELAAQGRLSAGNLDLLESYIAAVATARRAERSVQRQGSFFLKKGQRPQAHPGIAIAQEARKQARMLASRLALIQESRDANRAASGDFVAADDDEDFGDV